MKKSNKVVPAILLLFSVVIYYNTFSISKLNYGEGVAGTAFYPRFICIALASISIILFFQDFINQKKEKGKNIEPNLKAEVKDTKYVWFMVFSAVIYAILLQVFGYIISTIAFLIVAIYVLDPNVVKKRISIIVISVAITAGTYLAFSTILSVFLPTGILW